MNIINPEDVKEILTKYEEFPKLAPIYKKLLAAGFATLEGEEWARHKKIINPAFHLDKLKVLQYSYYHPMHSGLLYMFE